MPSYLVLLFVVEPAQRAYKNNYYYYALCHELWWLVGWRGLSLCLSCSKAYPFHSHITTNNKAKRVNEQHYSSCIEPSSNSIYYGTIFDMCAFFIIAELKDHMWVNLIKFKSMYENKIYLFVYVYRQLVVVVVGHGTLFMIFGSWMEAPVVGVTTRKIRMRWEIKVRSESKL